MTQQISPNILKNFIIKTVGSDKLSESLARQYDIDKNEFSEINENDNNYIELNELLKDDDLYEQFAVLYIEEQENKSNEYDAEKDKEEQLKIKDKSGASTA